MVRSLVVCLFVLAGMLAPVPSSAATKADVEAIAAKVKAHPKKVNSSGFYYVELARDKPHEGSMRILVMDKPGGVHQFGIRAGYVVTAKESDYSMDTPCVGTLSSTDGDGVVDNIQWNCIAHTPFMEKFVAANLQRIFDGFVVEAKALLKLE